MAYYRKRIARGVDCFFRIILAIIVPELWSVIWSTVFRRKFDNRPNIVTSLWPDLTLYTSEILHRYALGIHLKLYEILCRYRDTFQSYCRKTKGGQKNVPTPPGRLSNFNRKWTHMNFNQTLECFQSFQMKNQFQSNPIYPTHLKCWKRGPFLVPNGSKIFYSSKI